jgi:hypothetical protein
LWVAQGEGRVDINWSGSGRFKDKEGVMESMECTVIVCVLAASFMACGASPEVDQGLEGQRSAVLIENNTAFYAAPGGFLSTCVQGHTRVPCCTQGYAMVGLRADYGVFKCAHIPCDVQTMENTLSLDATTWRSGMHACPQGKVMVGINTTYNILACTGVSTGVVVNEFTDSGTEDGWPMHVCPSNFSSVMTGVDLGQNIFLCATDFFIP